MAYIPDLFLTIVTSIVADDTSTNFFSIDFSLFSIKEESIVQLFRRVSSNRARNDDLAPTSILKKAAIK